MTSSPGNLAAFRSDPPFIGPVTWLEDGVLNFVALYRRVAPNFLAAASAF